MSSDIDPAPPQTGTDSARGSQPRLIGRYQLVSEQGTGPFGTVWLAEDTASHKLVAVRLLPRELTDTENVAETIQRRASAVVEASHTHPGLGSVIEYGTTDDGRLFAVMERVEGQRLSKMLEGRGRLGVPATLQLAADMGGPVAFLHGKGLVHGALRPGNFAVADGSVILMDVETIALRDVSGLQHLVAAQSPAAFLAPEQILGLPITEKTDVYAFALTLYEMLTGGSPFEAATREVMIHRQLNAAPLSLRRRRKVPVVVETVIMEALDKRPEHRPYMREVLAHIASEASTAGSSWKRLTAVGVGIVLVAGIGGSLAWSVLAPRWSALPSVSGPAQEPSPAPEGATPPPVEPPPAPRVATPPPVEPPPAPRVATPPPPVEPPPAPRVATPPPPVEPPPAPRVATPPPPVEPPPAPRVATPPPPVVAPPPAPRATAPPVVAPPPAPRVTTPPVVAPRPAPRVATPPAVAPRPAPRVATPPPAEPRPGPGASTAPVAAPPPAPEFVTPPAPEPRALPAPAVTPAPPAPPAVAPSSPAPVRPAQTCNAEESDPVAVIDWLLNRRIND